MFIIQAPYPTLQTTTILPNPQFSDAESLLDTVDIKRAMDGTLYTYIKSRDGRRHLKWTFQLTRNKGLELRAFIQIYFAKNIMITDHNRSIWIGNFVSNPFEFVTSSKGGPAISPMLRGEMQTIDIEFEGIKNA